MDNTVLIAGAVGWGTFLVSLTLPKQFYINKWDKLTKGRWRSDRANLQIMLDHLKSFPEEWSISRNAASYPLTGAKKIYMNLENGKWNYTLSAFDSKSRPLIGHFEAQFSREIDNINARRERESLMRSFYPELDGTLRLK